MGQMDTQKTEIHEEQKVLILIARVTTQAN
jgi:hypothetical protein